MANPPGVQRALEYGMSRAAEQAEILRRKAAAPIKPHKPQQACDVGLFSDDADPRPLRNVPDQPQDGL